MQAVQTWTVVEPETFCTGAEVTCEFMLLVMPVNVDDDADVWDGLTRWPAFCGPLSCTLLAKSDLIREEDGCTVPQGDWAEEGSAICNCPRTSH